MIHRSSFPLALVIWFLAAANVHAQSTNSCWIKYFYDGAGNRVKREWWCGDPNGQTEYGEDKRMAPHSFGLTIQPNPTADQLLLTSETDLAEGEVSVVTLNGNVLYIAPAAGYQHTIDVKAFANGLYILRVLRRQEEFTTRFQVAH